VRAFRLLQATTLSVVVTRIAHGHATACLSIFTALGRCLEIRSFRLVILRAE
jgi:hypothetical protein